MTPLEIFISYAKIRGIMPELCKIANKPVTFWKLDTPTSRYLTITGSFKSLFDTHFSNNGFGNSIFVSLLYQYKEGDEIFKKNSVFNAHKKWLTFVKNNVIMDNMPKYGDTIKYISFGIEGEGTIEFIKEDYSRIRVRKSEGVTQYIQPGNVLEINGKPFEFSFHFKWKGKEHGKK